MSEIGLIILSEKGHSVLKSVFFNYSKFLKNVIIGTDKNVRNDYSENSLSFCEKNNIPYKVTNDVKPFLSSVKGYWIVISWRWLIPVDDNIIIIHDSILPSYRGFSPLVNSLINGESKIGASAIFISKNYDEGEIIFQKEEKISYPIKIKEAIELVSKLYVLLALKMCKVLCSGRKLKSIKQDGIPSYSLWRNENDYYINWEKQTALEIKRFVDALGDPYDGAKSYVNGEIYKIEEVNVIKDFNIINRSMSIGKVIKIEENFPIIVCKIGLLKVLKATSISGESLIPLKKFRTKFS